MTINYSSDGFSSTSSTDIRRQYLLHELYCGALRARLAASDLEAIGIALKGGLISPYEALEFAADADAIRFVGLPLAEAEK
jgi:hypothetical protein